MMDLHCHVDLYPDHQEVLNDIKSSNYYVLSVTTVPSAFEGTVQLTSGIKHCKTALGLHPQLAHLRKNELALFDKLVDRTRYIGEIGLDGSKGYADYFDDQLEVFTHILKKCEGFDDKILTIHSLNATGEVLLKLRQHPEAGIPILHWFLGTKKQVLEAVELGCFFSIGPAMLTSARAKKVISWIPQDRILLETDGPFAKVAGSILFPSNVDTVTEFLSEIWCKNKISVTEQLSVNLRCLTSGNAQLTRSL
ncbi:MULTISPECIES: Qat anti-phage system TatD family nuclease QatD [Pseudoalteromonas]|jgi:TatD DNase family protein|uniref:Qat anti-phage system TatD family nuclease QatD n=2 Tax=Pseudoalteromonas TaxID=53246 RepID=A0A8I2HC02_9GAMM|nr:MULTISPECIES: Qat anti-phage system TatD family nuclease QatD [Pseudoalteromonas]NLR23896.1 TatD family deoxyribonuclease [Pseudoalteromonas maricaloris]WOX29609.1 Qat anti-phage system TatD family nuclease QatD [Pseudoalteromonas maricaloris]